MSHDLSEIEEQTTFVYNKENGHPWHQLGIQFSGYMQMEEALELSRSDDTVIPVVLNAVTPRGDVGVEDTVGMWSDIYGLIATGMTPGFVPKQRSDMVKIAYDIVGLDGSGAHIDTMGNLNGSRGQPGAKFFTYIMVPELVIDPNGIADTIERGLAVGTSFDGSLPNFIHYTNIRTVCNNTLMYGWNRSSHAIRVKHTKNSEERIIEAANALKYVGAMEKVLVEKAEEMLKIQGDVSMNRIMNHFYPITKDLDGKALTRRQTDRALLQRVYDGPNNKNVDKVGRNGWAAYNAFVEVADHFRPVRGKDKELTRAMASVGMSGETVIKQKYQAAELVLN